MADTTATWKEDPTKLRAAYDLVYEMFAADTREIAKEVFGGDMDRTYHAMIELEEKAGLVEGMIVNGRRGSKQATGTLLTWQAYQTYDSTTAEEHSRIAEEHGLPLAVQATPVPTAEQAAALARQKTAVDGCQTLNNAINQLDVARDSLSAAIGQIKAAYAYGGQVDPVVKALLDNLVNTLEGDAWALASHKFLLSNASGAWIGSALNDGIRAQITQEQLIEAGIIEG